MNINILSIEQRDHRFTTIGDWWEDDAGILQIRITKMPWRFEVAVLFHELIEFFICKADGIKTKECDEFDALFEREYESGIWPKSVEAGFDKRCPYRKGHVWGSRFERVTIWVLGASWREYCDFTDNLMGVTER